MIIVYGATGYTGRLVAARLARSGLTPVLAGRQESSLKAVAEPLGLQIRVGGLEDLDLSGVRVLLNCAGPFALTQPPLLRRCLAVGVHYLDLAGEVAEHQSAQAFDKQARHAGILIMPGVGYGIAASDCLAAHVAAQVPDPRSIEVALKTVGGVSRGTAAVLLGSLRSVGVQRQEGRLVPRRAGADQRRIDFGDGNGPSIVVTNPWRADLLASVPHAPDYQTFMAFPAPIRALMHIPHGGLLRALARRLPEGPNERVLAAGTSAVWARATGAHATTATAVLRGPDAYLFTALTAEACLRRVLANNAPAGFHTPASAWGADLVLGLPGITHRDL